MMAAGVLALDPGREKVGVAVVDKQGTPLHLNIIKRSEIVANLEYLLTDFNPEKVVIGDGTGSRLLAEEIKSILPSDLELNFIEESKSSSEAVKLYRQREGDTISNIICKFISWRPSRPLDDYAALVLAKKYLRNK